MREKFIEKIFGAPGTGKTYNLIARLQHHLDDNCPFDQTLTTTFTKVAARNIRSRIAGKNKFTDKQLLANVRTIDSYLMNQIKRIKIFVIPVIFQESFMV